MNVANKKSQQIRHDSLVWSLFRVSIRLTLAAIFSMWKENSWNDSWIQRIYTLLQAIGSNFQVPIQLSFFLPVQILFINSRLKQAHL